MMTGTPELLPCPICKSDNIGSFERQEGLFVVSCENDDCIFCIEVHGSTYKEARDRWNTRAPSTVVGSGAALAALLTWCQIERGKLVVDGYDYKSGEEYGIRRVELQIERAIASKKEGK